MPDLIISKKAKSNRCSPRRLNVKRSHLNFQNKIFMNSMIKPMRLPSLNRASRHSTGVRSNRNESDYHSNRHPQNNSHKSPFPKISKVNYSLNESQTTQQDKIEVSKVEKWLKKKKYNSANLVKTVLQNSKISHSNHRKKPSQESNPNLASMPSRQSEPLKPTINQEMLNLIMVDSQNEMIQEQKRLHLIEEFKKKEALKKNLTKKEQIKREMDHTQKLNHNFNIDLLKEIAIQKIMKRQKRGKKLLPLSQMIQQSIGGFEHLRKTMINHNTNFITVKDITKIIDQRERERIENMNNTDTNPYKFSKDSWKIVENFVEALKVREAEIIRMDRNFTQLLKEKGMLQKELRELRQRNNKITMNPKPNKPRRPSFMRQNNFQGSFAIKKRVLSKGRSFNTKEMTKAAEKSVEEKLDVYDDKIQIQKSKISKKKVERDLLKDELMNRLDYLLKHPSLIKQIGMSLFRVVFHKLRFKEDMTPSHLPAEFTPPEREYIVSLCYIMYDPEGKFGKSKGLSSLTKSSINDTSLKFRGMPNMAYPRMDDLKVRKIPSYKLQIYLSCFTGLSFHFFYFSFLLIADSKKHHYFFNISVTNDTLLEL